MTGAEIAGAWITVAAVLFAIGYVIIQIVIEESRPKRRRRR